MAILVLHELNFYIYIVNDARVVFGASVAVGKDNFENIISDRLTFVGKLMLIKEFIESSDFVSLILRPRRFGNFLRTVCLVKKKLQVYLITTSQHFEKRLTCPDANTCADLSACCDRAGGNWLIGKRCDNCSGSSFLLMCTCTSYVKDPVALAGIIIAVAVVVLVCCFYSRSTRKMAAREVA
ncbi:hypothetical protein Glove_327g4 [Diversispora epigaea]|uniref:AAA-ATPase-like domain-containing protein n=1 Tax=Diversispora epigaea TaxID=1348612 RepID=A0A397HTI3_9GLOM|nr:hypothetical protein Glove_327g4 [Diversispora epigaea]